MDTFTFLEGMFEGMLDDPDDFIAAFLVGIFLLNRYFQIQEEITRAVQMETAVATPAIVLACKCALEAPQESRSRKRVKYDWDRARMCIHADYWGASHPTFNDQQFERFFRVTRTIAQRILNLCGATNLFFTERKDLFGNAAIEF